MNPTTETMQHADAATDAPLVRGQPIPAQGVGGHDQTWYPICTSAQAQPGQVHGTDWMNGRVIVVRDRDGRASVLSAYCRHLGADLAGGDILDGEVRCPFHHWRYDAAGRCTATGVGDPAPAAARLFAFPTHEAFGLVWAFNGREALFDPPSFDLPEADLIVRTVFDRMDEVDHFIPFSNSSDIFHLKAVHGMDLTVDPAGIERLPHGLRYAQAMHVPGQGAIEQQVRIFGTNCLTFRSRIMGRDVFQMSAGKALPGNRTLSCMVAATNRSTGAPGEDAMIDAILDQGIAFGRKLFEEDDRVLRAISFRQDVLTASDRMLAAYLAYVRAFPRSDIAADMIR